ncbi:MAG: V-type ATP synthase subunit F [Deferrisomatales bacterium]
MYRYVVITDRETAPGFRLAGLEVQEVADREAAEALRRTLEDREVGLVALNERFLPLLPEELRRRVEAGRPPVVVPFPDLRRAAPRRGEEYLAQLIQRAIGYRIRLRP